MFTPTLYASSEPLYHVLADSAQHVGMQSSTTVCHSLPKVTKVSDFHSIHLCLQESRKREVQGGLRPVDHGAHFTGPLLPLPLVPDLKFCNDGTLIQLLRFYVCRYVFI
jgi:hypothetical protein